MSKLKIIRASAGSGKTYCITFEYLLLLFKNHKNFRHILAVTFTNKATEEMKRRIIDELFILTTDEDSSFRNLLISEFNYSENDLKTNARLILNSILHNYSRLSITTIDSFFQRIIKAFAREAGLQFNFEVELEINEVLEKAAEQMIMNLGENLVLTNWLVDFAEKRVGEGKSWDFKKEILKLGRQLFNEKFNSFPISYHKSISDKNNLVQIHKQLSNLVASYENILIEAGKKATKKIAENGLTSADFKHGTRGGIGSFFYKLASGNLDLPGKFVTDANQSISEWLPKDKSIAIQIQAIAEDGLFQLLNDSIRVQSEKRSDYNTAKAILDNFYTLGILSDLVEEVSNYRNQKNIFLLAQAGQFLNSIIDENDAPFIYEKAGQTYSHFMIDEFQDTSGIQWANFKPLILNSLASNNRDILVGDIKQSIYRWRNSDWKIMAQQVELEMCDFGIKLDTLQQNWRSAENIIAFNNSFFTKSAQILQTELTTELLKSKIPEKELTYFNKLIISAYSDCNQNISEKTALNQGLVKIQFIENQHKDWSEQVLTKLPETIEELLKNGQQPRDIAILVRNAKHGREIIEYLNHYYELLPVDYPYKFKVLSNESAFVENADVIRFVLKVFRYIILPDDKINAAGLANDFYELFEQDNLNAENRFSPENILPQKFTSKIDVLRLLTPQELFEQAINIFGLNNSEENLPFLQTFNDCIIKFESTHSASLLAFIQHWEEKKEKISVSVSDEQNAVRILTIHKSKGLEFQSVIIPFCDWSLDHISLIAPIIWCSVKNEPFNTLEYFPVKYSSNLSESAFSTDYFLEKGQTFIDNLNLLYVAFTRAMDNLIVFCPKPEKLEKINSTSALLYNTFRIPDTLLNKVFPNVSFSIGWNEEHQMYAHGTIKHLIRKKKKNECESIPLSSFTCNAINENLKQSAIISDFWENLENSVITDRSYGNIMHKLFQEIITISDIQKAIKKLSSEGFIREQNIEELEKNINHLISDERVKEWYSGKYKTITESALIVPESHTYRPDRVMFSDDSVIVLDYKFGKKQSNEYSKQVKEYATYIRNMGYTNVVGILWYVNLSKIEKINLNELPMESL